MLLYLFRKRLISKYENSLTEYISYDIMGTSYMSIKDRNDIQADQNCY